MKDQDRADMEDQLRINYVVTHVGLWMHDNKISDRVAITSMIRLLGGAIAMQPQEGRAKLYDNIISLLGETVQWVEKKIDD